LLSLGDLVWLDDGTGFGGVANDGALNGTEAGIEGVVLQLLDGIGSPVLDGSGSAITTTTDAGGWYRFTGLVPGDYRVEVLSDNFSPGGPLAGLLSSEDPGGVVRDPNSDQDELVDENGADDATPEVNGIRSLTLTLELGGEPITDSTDGAGDPNANFTLDFGFVPQLNLGNQVWFDVNNNGLLEPDEPVISDVVVVLYEDTNGDGIYTPGVDQQQGITTTNAGGYYTFTNLPEGGYVVVITSSNFATNGPLDGHITSTTAVTGNSDANNNNHGYLTGTLGVTGYVASTVVTLTAGDEPDDSGRSNYSIDFGFLRLDYGDLPDSSVSQAGNHAPHTYPTRNGDDGARHVILPDNNPTLGERVDAEADGQPETPARGDDDAQSTAGNGTLPGDDEDGVSFPNGQRLIPGEVLTLTVSTLAAGSNGADGRLTAWIDLDGDGQLEANERIVVGQYITAGETITLSVPVPLTVPQGITTYARFRLSSVTETVTAPTGLALAGEVEDYALPIVAMDYGDLPDSGSSTGVYSYPTQNVDDGARHIIVVGANPTLGDFVDAETDGQPSANADGDDTVTSTLSFGNVGSRTDDEDGITFDTLLIAGQRATITVRTLATIYGGTDGSLNGWIDFDGNGTLDADERIVTDTVIVAGDTVQISFVVPVDAITGDLYSRFRYSTDTGTSGTPTGIAADGEVEDYLVRVEAADLGDLPDGLYPTTYSNNGAAHIIDGTRLGVIVDAELDGQSSITAGLDDATGSTIQSVGGVGDDEDGVEFLTPIMPGRTAQIRVTAGTTGYLNSWFDFNGDGTLDSYTITAIAGPGGYTPPGSADHVGGRAVSVRGGCLYPDVHGTGKRDRQADDQPLQPLPVHGAAGTGEYTGRIGGEW
jgi:hypothetical protein